jgi:lysophospholipase L1-like esterase
MRTRLGAVLMTMGLGLAVAGPPTAASAAPPFDGLEYVALGDSYSAGFGLLPVVAGSPDGCYRAEQNYPHTIAAELGLNLTDMTCSGAVTANIDLLGQTTMNGVGPLPLQGSALSATTDIVTLTIGGNDLGFGTVAQQCIKLNNATEEPLLLPGFANCKAYFEPIPGDDALLYKLDNTVSPALERVFGYIATQAPNAKVFVLGYPQIAPDFAHHPPGCYSSPVAPPWPNPPFAQNTVPYSPTDIFYLHHIENEMDDAIETAANSHGFSFIPTWDASAGHTVCDGPEANIFGIGFTQDPTKGTPLFGDLYVTLGALHPNEQGVPFMASAALAAIKGHPAFGGSLPASGKPQVAATGVDGTPLLFAGMTMGLVGLALMLVRRRPAGGSPHRA